MYQWLRPLFFKMNAETAHHFVLRSLSICPQLANVMTRPIPASERLAQETLGLHFPHPVGLAAGMDKNGIAVNGMLRCGFSFVEVGTVTPLGQPGNPKPRLFRLKEDEALVNRMGFNNDGADQLKRNLMKKKQPGVLGVNLGKNKLTPNEDAISDYLKTLRTLFLTADYFVINVSSPNTPGLRDLQSEQLLVPLVQAVIQERNALSEQTAGHVRPHRPPVLVKLAPDLSDEALTDLAPALTSAGADGFIATNTTILRDNLRSTHQTETGGLSGRPLKERSTAVIRLLYNATKGSVPIVGSGGIFDADDAYEKIRAGASLVQLYTGFVYRGPQIIQEIVQGLDVLVQRDGFSRLVDAVGVDAGL